MDGPSREVEGALLFDEINIVGDVAFKVLRGEYHFFGFVDSGAAAGVAELFRKGNHNPSRLVRKQKQALKVLRPRY